MASVDEQIESLRARGEDRESHGCARHAPAGLADPKSKTANLKLPPHCLLPIAYCLLFSAYGLLPTAKSFIAFSAALLPVRMQSEMPIPE